MGESFYTFYENDFQEDAFNKLEIESIFRRRNSGPVKSSGYSEILIQLEESNDSNIYSSFSLGFGNNLFEEREYPVAETFSDTGKVVFPRFFLNEDGRPKEYIIDTGVLSVNSYDSENFDFDINLSIANQERFDSLTIQIMYFF
ncbi:MAG: hypothetical protein BalsKO_21780 [Balneolaceae bacterium]